MDKSVQEESKPVESVQEESKPVESVQEESKPVENIKEENNLPEQEAARLGEAIDRLTQTVDKLAKNQNSIKVANDKIDRLEKELNEYSKNVGRRLTPYRVEDFYSYNNKLKEFNNEECKGIYSKSERIWDAFEI